MSDIGRSVSLATNDIECQLFRNHQFNVNFQYPQNSMSTSIVLLMSGRSPAVPYSRQRKYNSAVPEDINEEAGYAESLHGLCLEVCLDLRELGDAAHDDAGRVEQGLDLVVLHPDVEPLSQLLNPIMSQFFWCVLKKGNCCCCLLCNTHCHCSCHSAHAPPVLLLLLLLCSKTIQGIATQGNQLAAKRSPC